MKKISIFLAALATAVLLFGLNACGSDPAESDIQKEALQKRLGMFNDAQKFEKDQNASINELQVMMVLDSTISDSLTQWFTSMMTTTILPKQAKLIKSSKEILVQSDSLLQKHADGVLDSDNFEREFSSLKAEHDRLTSDMETLHNDMLQVVTLVKEAKARSPKKKE